MRQPVPFGKYLLLDRISVGGMAEVFKAKSYGVEGFEKIIAIKRILPTMGEDRDFIKMFIDEAKIAGQLAHANICQIFELGRIDGSHFIAMEYIWGKDLLQIQNRLRKLKQPMPVPMACFVIAKVLEGLDYAHRKRDPLGRPLEIVHRDCSPQNVLVSYEGEVKVIDFGIAKATSRNSRTMAGVLKGKFGYMSPEQVRGLPLDRRSDIFALGTMMYECLTGDRLFQGETDFSTLEKVRNVDIQAPRAVNPQIPEVIEKVILKALAKDVDDRYQWCSEMLADLQQFLMSQDVVFTAKSLSSWLKEVFAQEIERERQQLEQYKRVGRDGLIAGVPAAAAKVDVVATLGEAGMPEGDATQLGGPNFDDIENALQAGAAPALGPASGSPAATGRAPSSPAPRTTPPPQKAQKAPEPAPPQSDDEDDGFGEEAPTEIFGEIDEKPAAATPAAGRPAAATPGPSGIKPPTKPAPRNTPVPMAAPAVAPLAAAPASNPSAKTVMQPGGLAAFTGGAMGNPAEGFVPATASPAAGVQAQSYGGNEGLANNTGPQARTVLGVTAPAGLGNYGGGYVPPNLAQSHPGVAAVPGPTNPGAMGSMGPGAMNGMGSMGPMQSPYGQPNPSEPSIPNYGAQYPSAPNNGYPGYGYDPYNQQPYGSGPQAGYGYGTPPVDPNQVAPEGKKKSSIGRDVAIGVGIAALVLGGFLAVKFLILDKDKGTETADSAGSAQPQIATIEIAMPDGITAEFFVDEKRIATVENGRKLPVTAGLRKIKLLAPNGSRCEQPIELPAGETKTVQCIIFTGNAGSAGSAAGSGSAIAGSAAAPGTGSGSAGSAAKAAGSGSAAGSAAVAVEKTAAEKAAEKAAAEKAARDAAKEKAAAEKAAKLAAEKEAAEKAAAEKAAAEKARQERLKAERDRKNAGSGSTTLPPEEKLPPGTKGFLTVSSKPPGAKVSIDNVDTGQVTPITKGIALPPGRHKVTFTIGNDRHTFSVNITAGKTENLSKELK